MSEVKVDTISERTTDAGVTVEGVKIEDGVATFQTAAGSPLVFEGATANAYETTFAITDPTADRTITFPDESVTLGSSDFVKIHTITADDDANITFSSTYITSDYKQLIFLFYGIKPATDNQDFRVHFSVDNGSNYPSNHDGTTFYSWKTATDTHMSSSTTYGTRNAAYSVLTFNTSSDTGHGFSGEMKLQYPGDTVNIKSWQFYGSNITYDAAKKLYVPTIGGIFDNTSAINNVKFAFASGNITSGSIALWGMK